jgi:hypothetical protein
MRTCLAIELRHVYLTARLSVKIILFVGPYYGTGGPGCKRQRAGACTPSPARTLLLGHRSYGLIRQSHLALLSFGLSPVQEVFAGCYQPLLPPGSSRRDLCESFLGCLVPSHGGPTECIYLFLPPCHRPSPRRGLGRLPASVREYDFSRGGVFEAADISLCSGLRVCSSPRSFLPLHKAPQGSRDFYIRAERASLSLHATGYANRPNTGN